MKKKMQNVIFILLWLIAIGLMIGCAVKDRELTPDEIAAAETTARLKAERSQNADDFTPDPGHVYRVDGSDADLPDSSPDREEEEVSDATDQAARFIDESPDVYEDYQAPEEEVHPAEDKWQDGAYQFTSDEIWEMTRITYLENGITYPKCTYQTVYLTACVILNRLYDWDECHTIADVIWEGGQYSTANRYHDYDGSDLGSSNPDGWSISEEAVWDAINNTDRNPHFQSMGAQGAVYYQDPNTGETFSY